MRDVWLSRHDHAIEEEEKTRRKGRPKSAKEMNLENLRLMDEEQYRTGFGEFMACSTINHPKTNRGFGAQSCQT